MSTLVIIGTQWGDEGKGKVVHLLGKKADYIVRYQGGNNAGHTVIFDNRMFILHLVPSGILLPGKICLIGNGVVVDPQSLKEEVDLLKQKGISVHKRLFVSNRAHVILPYHRYLDKLKEKGSLKIGTTGKGIGPAYSDKVARIGIRIADYLEPETFKELLETNVREKKPLLDKVCNIAQLKQSILRDYPVLRNFLKPMAVDVSILLENALKRKKNIIFESAQGTLLDVDFGSYPFVTSSNPVAGGVCAGAGIPPNLIDETLGILKAYTTRVGEGPFPSEQTNRVGEFLRKNGKEFGSTTGRPRRCGWFDAVAARHSVRLNGIKKLALTKLDVLSGINPVKICVAYKYQGRRINDFPASQKQLAGAKPVYIAMPGFSGDLTAVKSWDKMPVPAKKYVKKLEQLIGASCAIVSLGRSRDETIIVDKKFKWI
ncbi:MAG: adenylosuccinate synthase [bacterium]